MVVLDLQNEANFANIPDNQQIQTWLNTAAECLPTSLPAVTITIRLIDKEESAFLNETYRHKKGPTNVLSFPDESIPGFDQESLGDLAICIPVVIEEAKTQQKTFIAHFAHLVIHGFLHLLNYDHENDQDAEIMESLEKKILQRLGFEDPY